MGRKNGGYVGGRWGGSGNRMLRRGRRSYFGADGLGRAALLLSSILRLLTDAYGCCRRKEFGAAGIPRGFPKVAVEDDRRYRQPVIWVTLRRDGMTGLREVLDSTKKEVRLGEPHLGEG